MEQIPGFGKSIFKKDEKIDFTKEQIEFAKSFKDAEVEIKPNSIVIFAPTGEQAESYALKLVNKFPKELKLLWSKAKAE